MSWIVQAVSLTEEVPVTISLPRDLLQVRIQNPRHRLVFGDPYPNSCCSQYLDHMISSSLILALPTHRLLGKMALALEGCAFLPQGLKAQ